MTRKLELGVEIQELNDQGVYEPVEVQVKPDVYCGGVFQLRQVGRKIISKLCINICCAHQLHVVHVVEWLL